jgi:hypothetical protein
MITAQEARQLAGPTPEEYCEFFASHIEKAAKEKKRTVTVYHGQLENEAYGRTQVWKDFVAAMAKLGFTASLYYEERQFVDIRITITW